MRIGTLSLILVCFGLLACGPQAPGTQAAAQSSGDPAALMVRAMDSYSFKWVPIGTFNVIGSGGNTTADQVWADDYEHMKCFAEAGLIRFDHDEDLTQTLNEHFSFSTMHQVSLEGITRRVTVSATPEGEAASASYESASWAQRQRSHSPYAHMLIIQVARYSSPRIVIDRTIEREVNRYRLIGATFTVNSVPVGRSTNVPCLNGPLTSAKSEAIFRWDAFANEWVLVGSHAVWGDTQLPANWASQQLARLQ